ncbi:transglutaminase domain-containing protein, partial [Endozoicomonas sp. SESOKO2]|uniref:transglutaminase domain-containing protein n=1 Tax=Endozoicomonas sp. SESOKO2 TaxID=2828743 RepID=UPI002147E472
HYRLYLMAAGISLEALPESSALVTALTMSNGELDSGLCQWFNQTVSDVDRPWLIRRSYLNSIDEKRHEIRIKAELNGEEARAEIIKSVARIRWLASGLSLKPDQSEDILTQALYRHWQQRWFDRKFGETGTDANSVFCLTEEQALTLKLSVSQPHLREAEKRIEAWNSNAVRLWPGFWHQISDLSNHWVDDSEKYKPEVEEKHAPALDRRTKYEGLELPTVCDYKIFNTQKYPSHMYRCQVIDTYVTAKGDVKLIEISDQHIQGFETLMPARLPGRDQEVTLASDQTLATFEVSPKNGQYALPSLTPNDYIVALRIEPDLAFTLVRNRYTGLHRLSIPEAKANQSFQVAYILEPRGSGEKTPAKKALPERSLHFDTHCSEGMKTVLNKLFRNTDQDQGILWKIKSAKDTKQRIEAITEYCQNFSGEAQPERWMNFFQFLVTRRQGSCRHRVPVFIAFCRYYGIPSRQVDSLIHSFAEYSGDGGRTWESVDLGGAPLEPTEITSDFQTTRKVCASGTESRNIKDLLKDVLKGADLTQQQILAEAIGMSLEELKKVLETHNALPGTNPSTSNMIKNLWKEKDLTGFSVGVSMLVSMGLSMLLETEAPGNDDQELADDETDGDEHIYKLMSEAVREILSKNDEDQVSEQLKSLHSKIIDQTGASPHEWLRSIVDILKHSDLTKPSVIYFAREALESGWLDAVTTLEGHSLDAHWHHQLLVRLEGIDELKVEAAHCLKKWYKELLSRGKNSQIWQSAYQYFQKEEGGPLFITHDHEGFSKFLENKIANPSLQTTWTDEPKGVPNIERMLVYHPAFSQLTSSKAHHRPVIVLGQPDWYRTMINQKVEALLAENSPNLKQLLEKINQDEAVKEQRPNALQAFDSQCDLAQKPDIEGKYKPILESLELPLKNPTLVDDLKYKAVQSIHQAFTHYLYRVTHSKGGCLTYCWVKAAIGDSTETDYYGAYDPSSPEELFLMMCNINSSLSFQNSVKDANLQQALNVNNALVLRSDELTTIAEEFVSSVNLNSICDSLVQARTVFFANDHCP